MADKKQGRHMADKVWRRGQSGHKAGHKMDTWRTSFWGADTADSKGGRKQAHHGHMADKLQGQPEHIAPFFFQERTPRETVWGILQFEPVGTFQADAGQPSYISTNWLIELDGHKSHLCRAQYSFTQVLYNLFSHMLPQTVLWYDVRTTVVTNNTKLNN